MLTVPHRELDRGARPKQSSGVSVIASIDLHPLEVTYFAPVLLRPPEICLSGPCLTESPVRFELVGPRGRTSRTYGTWSCAEGDGRGQCEGPIETWTGYSMSNAWLDIAPDDEALHVFVSDQLVYSIRRSKLPMSARVVLLTEPEYALALSFGDSDPEGSFVAVSLDAPAFDFLGASLKVRRRSDGCWSLIELGDLPFVDPLSVRLSDGFRTKIYELPLQDGVPPAASPKASSAISRLKEGARAQLPRHAFEYGEPLGAVDLSFADLRKAYFRSVNARGARLHQTRLQQAYLHLSDFARADFSETDLSRAYLIGVDLRDTDFRGANLARTRLDRCDLRGANLESARNLTQAQLDAACGNALTKLPPGLSISGCTGLDASEQAASSTDEAVLPSAPTELLVATASQGCTTKQCPGQCCNTCGHVQWKLASDSNAEVVSRGVTLPEPVANECGLHYDLRAEGHRLGDSFLVHSVRPVPSGRGRHPGAPGQLELLAMLDVCTVMGCSPEDPCCNSCSFNGWRPKTTLDVVTWSGAELPLADLRACGEGFDLAVTGTWLGLNAFEVTSVRELRW